LLCLVINIISFSRNINNGVIPEQASSGYNVKFYLTLTKNLDNFTFFVFIPRIIIIPITQ